MKISGFTIIKNAVLNDYPVTEAIRSVLPVVDEMVVLVGDCGDDTLQLIESIKDPKIRIHHSVWDKTLTSGGSVLAAETDKAFALVDPESTWAFYIQADEVIHEKYHSLIKEACEKYKNDNRVEGLLFKYVHFYATYDYIGDSRKWYHREVRIIRNNKQIKSYKDAQGFRVEGKRKINAKLIDAFIYHYGWVKSPEQMMRKQKNLKHFWRNEAGTEAFMALPDFFDYSAFDSLERFTGTHPAVMQKRIELKNWEIRLDISKKRFSLKKKLLYWFEKKTGIRLFSFKNYKLIR